MLRRAASGHIEATQLPKFAAASRIARAVISGWPDAPSSPLQGGGEPSGPGVACAAVPDFCPEKMLPNRFEIPPPDDWALAAPDSSRTAATITAAALALINGSIARFMSHPLPSNSGFQEAPSRFP